MTRNADPSRALRRVRELCCGRGPKRLTVVTGGRVGHVERTFPDRRGISMSRVVSSRPTDGFFRTPALALVLPDGAGRPQLLEARQKAIEVVIKVAVFRLV